MQIIINLKQKKNLLFFLLLTVSLFLQSCVSEDKSTVSYYDLGIPSPIYLEGINLDITPFLNYSEVSSEMLYRVGSNKIGYDQANRWARSPNILITAFFRNSLKINKENGGYIDNKFASMTLSAAVTAFDIDLQNKKTIIGINYKILYKGNIVLVQNKIFEQKFEKEIPSAFASSMSLSAAELLKTICTQAEELKKVIIKQDNSLKGK